VVNRTVDLCRALEPEVGLRQPSVYALHLIAKPDGVLIVFVLDPLAGIPAALFGALEDDGLRALVHSEVS
jgi:hypothetical protein